MQVDLTPVRYLKGIGDVRASYFEKLNIKTARDLIYFYPRAYENRGNIINSADAADGSICSFILKITVSAETKVSRSGMQYIKAIGEDGGIPVTLTFFNQSRLAPLLREGNVFRFYGKVTLDLYGVQMVSPVMEEINPSRPLLDIVPVYPLTKGLTQGNIRNAVQQCSNLIKNIPDVLPERITDEYSLMKKSEAIRTIHIPKDMEVLKKARRTLAFEELLAFQTALRQIKMSNRKKAAYSLESKGTGIGKFVSSLPFELTGGQKSAVKDCIEDMQKSYPMARMIQGDVGSGKTVIAAAAMYYAAKNKLQSALMAPTEILARQHYSTLSKLFENSEITVALLTGSMKAKEKREVKKQLAEGEINIIVGTHALIQSDVEFEKLGLTVTDEQHRFGVSQRSYLTKKNSEITPHSLVMSATPIPRSLSLVLYADMDVSVVGELPSGRKKIETFFVNGTYRERIYEFIRKEINGGGRAYIICPLVDDSSKDEEENENGKKAVMSYTKQLKERVFSDIGVGVVHGKMPAEQKEKVMAQFKAGEISILVSTTVIEVGIDVPEATVMFIENAECFGLSQLHQLRGRVGRGSSKSYCVLMSDNESEKTRKRLEILCETNDGYKIANEDMLTRGPGDFFGERQSGEVCFKTATLADMEIVEETRKLSAEITKNGELSEEFLPLAAEAKKMFNSIESNL